MVQLRDTIVAPADQREHLAGVRIEGNQRDLRIRDRCMPFLCSLRIRSSTFFMPASTASEAARLQLRIERRVDAQRAGARDVRVAEALHDLVVHEVDEVGRFAAIHVRRREAQRLGLGALRLRRQ